MSEATDWLFFAQEDLRVAELTFSAEIYHQVCFHSQQCCEKAIKACIVHQGVEPPRVHQLSVLLSLLMSDVFGELNASIVRLDRFYIPTRYPDAPVGSLPEGLPGMEDAEEAIETARKTFQQAECIISPNSSN